MKNQSLSALTTEQQETITDNMAEAMQILYASVKARKEKEYLNYKEDEKKDGKTKTI